MILLFNVKITSYGLSYYPRAGHMPKYNRLDIFKYCLASYTAMLPLLSKVILYIQLESEFQNQQESLEAYIRELFPEELLELHWYRNNYTREWRVLCDKYFENDDDIIWFAGNDDHIFIDYDLDVLSAGIKLLREDPDPYSVVYYSHWPEQMRLSMQYQGELTEDKNYIKFHWRTFDAIRILKASRFKRYWHDTDFGDQLVFRTDTLYHAGYELTSYIYSPTRELVRHYDGYGHVGDLSNIVPPIIIPPGFFEKNMTVRFGNVARDNKVTTLNPMAAHLYSHDPTGVDYRWLPEDIPLFWRDRITNLEIVEGTDFDAMTKARDEWYIKSTRIPMHCYQMHFDDTHLCPPVEWLTNNLRHGKN
jgi:hypothetical protein